MVFFERGKSGTSLGQHNICVTRQGVDIYFFIRKNRICVSYTLFHEMNLELSDSAIDLALRYDTILQSSKSNGQ